MLFADGAGALVFLALWLFCVVDVIVTDDTQCRNLPKVAWLLIVLLLPALGSLAWLIAGHPWASGRVARPRSTPFGSGAGRPTTRYPEYDRPGRAVASDPAADEAFLSAVRAKAEAQREEYRRRRAAELEAERRRLTEPPPTS